MQKRGMARARRALAGLAVVLAPAMLEGQALTRQVAARLLTVDSLYDRHVNWVKAYDNLEYEQACATITAKTFGDSEEGRGRATLLQNRVYRVTDTVSAGNNLRPAGTKVCILRVPDSVLTRRPTTESPRAARSDLLIETLGGQRQGPVWAAVARVRFGEIHGVLQDPGSSTADVEFVGAWRATPYTAGAGVDLSKFRRPRFTATFRRYDTGWRVTRVKFEGMAE